MYFPIFRRSVSAGIRGKHSAWMSTAFRRRTSRTQSGRSPAALPLPLTFSLRKEKRLLTTWRRSAGRGRFRRNGFEEMGHQKSIHGHMYIREIERFGSLRAPNHGLYSAAERRRFGSYVTADSLVFAAKNVQAGFVSSKRFRNGTSKKHTDFVRTGDRTVWLTSCAKPRLVLGGGTPPFWLLCYY